MKIINCKICNKEFKVFEYEIKKGRKFCSHQCYWSSSTGVKQINSISYTRFYRIWAGIKRRCYNKNEIAYIKYGGRGIKCLWNSFKDFRDDMYQSYQQHVSEYGEKQTTIDRIDNDSNYEKSNCRWATRKEQAMNRSSRKEITYKGQTKSIFEWAEHLNIPKVALWLRLFRYDWTVKRAFTEPIMKRTQTK